MKKENLVGTMLVLALILLLPSITAFEQQVIEKETIDTVLDDVKFPFIYRLVLKWFYFREDRINYLAEISFDRYLIDQNRNLYEYDIYHPILFLRCVMLILSTCSITWLIEEISDARGWNWEIPLL